jgi:hypothetical protein
MRKARRFTIVATVTIVAGIAAATVSPTANAGQYGWAAESGYGANTGTAAYLQTWSSWAVPESPSEHCTESPPYCALTGNLGNTYGEGYTDEAVWLLDHANQSNALEVGFASGWATGTDGGWTSALRPYYTTGDGSVQVNAVSSYDLPSGTTVWAQAQNDGTIQVNDWLIDLDYGVAEPRWNYAQYETAYGDDWMGGGSDSGALEMYYQPAGAYPNGWSNWGAISCVQGDASGTNAPFDYSDQCGLYGTDYEWDAYGYGNGIFGS